jgi:hypothetical protein
MMNHIYNSFLLIPRTSCDGIEGLISDTSASGTFPIFRIFKEFKKSIRRNRWRTFRLWITGSDRGILPFELSVVRATGQRINVDSPQQSSNYSFCIDERIYYRKLISRPSLGLSPPVC